MKIELLGSFGNDEMIASTARVSYAKKSADYTTEQNAKLIDFLVKHKHTSPFRHSTLQFRIKCPIYVERQLFKHQVGVSVNSISGRYVDFSDSYYKIEDWRTQSKDSKQGSGEDLDNGTSIICDDIQDEVIDFCKKRYDELIKFGVSKEQARSVLPLSLETEFIWTGTFLAFIHMCNLRLKSDTQKETRDIVNEMLKQVQELEVFNHSLKAFGY